MQELLRELSITASYHTSRTILNDARVDEGAKSRFVSCSSARGLNAAIALYVDSINTDGCSANAAGLHVERRFPSIFGALGLCASR